jgi:hypothetical protein
MRYVLILLVAILAICSYVLFTSYNSAKQALTKVHKEKYLCDKNGTNIANCSKNPAPSLPKGVCAPGGKCS